VALERISDAGLKRAARSSLKIQDAKNRQKNAKNSPSGHHRANLSGYIFATKAHIDNREKLVKHQYLHHMSLQYGELRLTCGLAEIVSFVWGTSANFNRFRILPALLHGTVVVGVSETLRR